MIKRSLLAGLALVLLPLVSGAFSVPKSDYVVDTAGVLRDAQSIKTGLLDYQQKTGHQIGVLIVPSLNDEPIEDVANHVFRAWGIGDKDRNDGALILVSTGDRQARIEVGYGLEGALTDITAKRIVSGIMIPRFKANDYDQGIKDGISAIQQSIAGEPVFPSDETDRHIGFDPTLLFIIGWPIIGILWRLFGRSKSWWAGGIAGGVVGGVVALVVGTLAASIASIVAGIVIGSVFDFLASKYYKGPGSGGSGFGGPWFFGGGSSGGGSGLSGGFGGGSSGGGGASGSW